MTMRKMAWTLFFASAVLLLAVSGQWRNLDGQVQARFIARPDGEALVKALRSSLGDVEMGLYALGSAQAGKIPDVRLYECLIYHPDALGVTLTQGNALTQAQLDRGEDTAMISEQLALALDPAMDCVGRPLTIGDRTYRIAGVYRARSPLGFLTMLDACSAIVPCREESSLRQMHLWIRTRDDSRYVHQQVEKDLDGLDASAEYGSSEAVDLGLAAKLGRQGARFWLWLDFAVLCIAMFRRLRPRRRQFLREIAERRRRDDAGTLLRNALPRVLTEVLPSLLLLLACAGSTATLLSGLTLDESVLPRRFLDLSAWRKMFMDNALRENAAQPAPVWVNVLCRRLESLCAGLGVFSFGALLLALGRER